MVKRKLIKPILNNSRFSVYENLDRGLLKLLKKVQKDYREKKVGNKYDL